jgi:hypothetical protein
MNMPVRSCVQEYHYSPPKSGLCTHFHELLDGVHELDPFSTAREEGCSACCRMARPDKRQLTDATSFEPSGGQIPSIQTEQSTKPIGSKEIWT